MTGVYGGPVYKLNMSIANKENAFTSRISLKNGSRKPIKKFYQTMYGKAKQDSI